VIKFIKLPKIESFVIQHLAVEINYRLRIKGI